ncbi:MAG TPA: hypothetical protein PK573_09990 [Spirochaetota bacterium]|nr:hypothetical protein [Spirochaetota bacterium]HRZ25822.1 hypothetical protein [Spirochaetota bacterium]
MNQKCIMILGMHRSGTSALAGVLDRLGVFMGKTLMPPNPNNPTGYYENLKVQIFNENKLLPRLKSAWDSTFSFTPGWENDKGLNDLYMEAREIIDDEYGDVPVFGIKDPRICRLFPFWEKVLAGMGVDICVILPVRNPLEIAASIGARNKYSTEQSVVLWMIHEVDAERYSRNHRRVFISYDAFVKNPFGVISSIETNLGLDFSETLRGKKDEIEKFIVSELKHHSIDSGRIETAPGFINAIISLFTDVSANYDASREKEIQAELDKASRDFMASLKFFSNDGMQQQLKRVNELVGDLRKRDQERKEKIAKLKSDYELLSSFPIVKIPIKAYELSKKTVLGLIIKKLLDKRRSSIKK